MNWYYIPEEDTNALFICPCPKKSKKGLTKSGKPFTQRWFCLEVDWDGDFKYFCDFPAKYMRADRISKIHPRKADIYRVAISFGLFEYTGTDLSEFF